MIDTLRAAGASVIAYDVEFREPTRRGRAAQGGHRAGRPAAPARRHADRQRGPGPDPRRPGQEAVRERRVRRVPDRRLTAPTARWTSRSACPAPSAPSLGHAGWRASRSSPPGSPGDPAERFERAWIDFHGPARTYPHHAFADVLRGADPSRFENKVVVVGTSARKQGDLHATAARRQASVMSGAEIQANAISTVRRGLPLRSLGAAGAVALIVLLGVLPALIVIATGPKLAGRARRGGRGRLPRAGAAAVLRGRVVPVRIPCSALLLSAVAVVAVRAAVAAPAQSPSG